MLQRMQLSIDPHYARTGDEYEAASSSSSSSSSSPSVFLSPTTDSSSFDSRDSASPISAWRMCFVLCLYEFTSDDQDHLPFRKGEILEIVKKEDSGWWAALRGEKIGWIPSAFVTHITENFAISLRHVREDLRVYHYEAERKHNPDVTQHDHTEYFEWYPISNTVRKEPFVHCVPTSGLIINESFSKPSTSLFEYLPTSPSRKASFLDGYSTSESESESDSVLDSAENSITLVPQPVTFPSSPATPMPHPLMPKIEPLHINKPTPPTPVPTSTSSSTVSWPPSPFRSRSDSAPTTPAIVRTRRLPIMLSEHLSLSNLSDLAETERQIAGTSHVNVVLSHKCSESELDLEGHSEKSPARRRANKVRWILGDDEAQAFHNAKQAQAMLPWYLQPSYTVDEIKLEYDGSVRAGTLPSLVERLVVDPLTPKQDKLYQHTFLTSYHTFSTPLEFFELLVERYQMDHPPGLSDDEFNEWKERRLRPVQKRVLAIMTTWLEQYDMLQDDPNLRDRLREFLTLIQSPNNLALSAKLILRSLERLSLKLYKPQSMSPTPTPCKKRKISRGHKSELIRIDPTEMAEQLALLEFRLYVKVRPKDCIAWSRIQNGKVIVNLGEFCANHDRIAGWVKASILQNEGLGRRADTVDFWIRVAEKCRAINNYASMTAIVAALTSSMIAKLQLTWAHVGRGAQLQALARFNEPTANFSAYRALHQVTNAPCIPFIAVFLTDIVHIADQLQDFASIPPSTASTLLTATVATSPNGTTAPLRNTKCLINFVKRTKWYEAVDSIVRFQKKGYEFGENANIMSFISDQLAVNVTRDESVLWDRSAKIQQSEMVHADIRKGLEAAGF